MRIRLSLIVLAIATGVILGEVIWVCYTNSLRYDQPINPIERIR